MPGSGPKASRWGAILHSPIEKHLLVVTRLAAKRLTPLPLPDVLIPKLQVGDRSGGRSDGVGGAGWPNHLVDAHNLTSVQIGRLAAFPLDLTHRRLRVVQAACLPAEPAAEFEQDLVRHGPQCLA